VLWVPIEADPPSIADRRVGRALLWRPDPDEEAALRADWEELCGLIGAGAIDVIDAHRGRHLQVRPKGSDGSVRRVAPGPDGESTLAMPRGFYLRASFTAALLIGARDQTGRGSGGR
jgi:DNA mismatch repair protein MutH